MITLYPPQTPVKVAGALAARIINTLAAANDPLPLLDEGTTIATSHLAVPTNQ